MYPTANDIVHRVMERLDVATEVFGFDNETDMVNNLTMAIASTRGQQSCFMSGAGKECKHRSTNMYVILGAQDLERILGTQGTNFAHVHMQ